MATYKSADQVAEAMRRAGEAMGKAQAAAVREASGKLADAVRAVSPARLSHVGKHGARLGLVLTASGNQATGRGTGPWPLIEYPTRPHLIGIGRSTRKRAKVRIRNGVAYGQILMIPGSKHPVTGPILHPGTRGKMVFHKGVALGHPAAVAVLNRTSWEAVKEAVG